MPTQGDLAPADLSSHTMRPLPGMLVLLLPGLLLSLPTSPPGAFPDPLPPLLPHLLSLSPLSSAGTWHLAALPQILLGWVAGWVDERK